MIISFRYSLGKSDRLLARITTIIEENINDIDGVDTWKEAHEYANSQKLAVVGGKQD
jgi:hypothetical protein